MTTLALPPSEARLQPLVRSAVRKAGGREPEGVGLLDALWDEALFGLTRVGAYREAPAEVRRGIREACCRGVLEEALFIEDAGMGFTARMTALARTEDERVLYALFSADEATHYVWVKEALGQAAAQARPNGFHALLAGTIADHPPEALVFLIQVFLEGWGIHRYGELLHACRSEPLRGVLAAILQDEARHHGSGVVLNAEGRLLATLSPGAREAMLDTLRQFLELVRVGPQAVLQALDTGLGGLTRAQRVQVMTELDAPAHSHARLQVLRGLLAQEKAFDVLDALERHDVFTPLPPERCV